MKKKSDPRHKLRTKIVKKLFEKSFRPSTNFNENSLVANVYKKHKEIDSIISKNAPAWPIKQIAPIDLATLRFAVWELMYSKKKEPYKVIIDEAVEIAKEYGSNNSASFVNGVLGSIINSNIKLKEEAHD